MCPPIIPPITLRLLLTALLGLGLSSCANPSFHHAWKQAAAAPLSDPFCGQWQGSWQSDVNHHHGNLRCIVTPPQSSGKPHQFFYRATWMRFLSGAYRAKHTITPSGPSSWTLAGSHQMPDWAGGLYTYQGSLSHSSFTATYACKLDRGTFTLSRPNSTPPPNKTLAKTPPPP